MHLRPETQPAIDHHLAQRLDGVRQTPDKQYPTRKAGCSRSQSGFEWQIGSQLLRTRDRAAWADRPERAENAVTEESLGRLSERITRVKRELFEPQR